MLSAVKTVHVVHTHVLWAGFLNLILLMLFAILFLALIRNAVMLLMIVVALFAPLPLNCARALPASTVPLKTAPTLSAASEHAPPILVLLLARRDQTLPI